MMRGSPSAPQRGRGVETRGKWRMTWTLRKSTKAFSSSVTIFFPCYSVCSQVTIHNWHFGNQLLLLNVAKKNLSTLLFFSRIYFFRIAEPDVHRGFSDGSLHDNQVQHRSPQLLPLPLHPEPHPGLVQGRAGNAQIRCQGAGPPQTSGKDEVRRDGHFNRFGFYPPMSLRRQLSDSEYDPHAACQEVFPV